MPRKKKSVKDKLRDQIGRIDHALLEVEDRYDKLIEIILAIKDDDDLGYEITGRSTKQKSKASGNSGFSGGCTPAAA